MSVRPTPGQPVPLHSTYVNDQTARLFWRLSYRAGRGYLTGQDARGLPVLVQHEREEQSSYQRRLRTTKARGYVGPILRRYMGVVFRRPPVRPAGTPPIYADVVADATGGGLSLDQVMRLALSRAQVDREAYLVPDVKTNATLPASPNVEQIRQAGARPIVHVMDAPCVLNWHDEAGSLCEILYIWNGAADGRPILRWMNTESFQDFALDEYAPGVSVTGSKVGAALNMPTPHGYDMVPVVRVRPVFDPHAALSQGTLGDSQAAPIAEAQQAIVNLLSLLNEEIYNVTFSQMIASGVSESQVKDVMVGNCRVLCLPNPASRVDFIGADPAQATSIRASLDDERSNLYQAAGLAPGDPSAASSGVALAWRASDMGNIVQALASAAEDAENRLWAVLASGWGFEAPAATQYPADADLPDYATEAMALLGLIGNASVPMVIRRKAAERFASRNLSLTADEEAEMLAAMQTKPAAAPGASPFPPRAPFPAADPEEAGASTDAGPAGT